MLTSFADHDSDSISQEWVRRPLIYSFSSPLRERSSAHGSIWTTVCETPTRVMGASSLEPAPSERIKKRNAETSVYTF